MKVKVLSEHGYEEAVLGFSLSYNTSIERTKEILPKYAFGIPGENKFLESIVLWVDVTAPRFWWQEADTYRVGSTKQSESSMHTLAKNGVTQENFEYPIDNTTLANINWLIDYYNTEANPGWKTESFARIKNYLPEGFLQRRIWSFNYKTLQNMYIQRINHRLPQWRYFLTEVTDNIEHKEYIIKGL